MKGGPAKGVFLMGERALLREFGDVCHSARLTVAYAESSGVSSPQLPKYMAKRRSVPRDVLAGVELTNCDPVRKKANLVLLDRTLPRSIPILSSSVTTTVTRQAAWLKHPERLIGISAFPTLLAQRLIELAPGAATAKDTVRAATEFAIRLRKDFAIVQDRIGMVLPRILCMVINEAFFALGEGIASPKDLDTAMRLGTNYPRGPVSWGDEIGLVSVAAVLDALHEDLGEERYRVAPVLRQLAVPAGERQS